MTTLAPTFDDVVAYLSGLDDVETQEAYGYLFFFVGHERKLPFATLANHDAEYDAHSNLDRPGVFRLNDAVTPETYTRCFGDRPAMPEGNAAVDTGHDFTAVDVLLPHPTYAPQSWVCVLSPSAARFDDDVKPLIAEAHAIARRRHAKG